MFGRTRHRVRGKPFKLFSDELPSVEFRDNEEKAVFRDTEEGNRVRLNKKRIQSFSDRLSLPSLGTPERDDASLTMSDSRISSSQSGNQAVLSPDLQELHDRIRLRHRIRENTQQAQPRGLPRRSTTLKIGQADKPTVVKRKKFPGREKLQDQRKSGTIETHFHRYEHAFTEDFGVLDNKSPSEDKFGKPKSLLQQLLDASARDFSRRKQINDGLIPNPMESLYRIPSGRVSSNDIRRRETIIPSEGTTTPQFRNEFKPGILKREVNKDRHSVQVPNISMPQGNSPKPRLVHSEHLDTHTDYRSEHIVSPGGVVSVHYDVPRNEMNDTLLMKKDAKQKRVYFKDDNDYLDIPEAEDTGKIEDWFRPQGPRRKPSRHRKSSPYPTEEVEMKFESCIDVFDDTNHKAKRNARDLSRSESMQTRGKKDGRLRQTSPYPKEELQLHEDRADTSNHGSTSNESNHGSLLGNMYPGDDHNSAFPTTPARKGMHFNVEINDKNLMAINSDAMKPHTPTSYPSFIEQIKAESKNSERNETPSSARLRRAHSERIGEPLNIPPLILPRDSGVHINERFIGSRNPEAVGLDELPDDFDLSELPEDIDRSLDGVELIKAYRLWDRERKAFPAGLRKIDIPFDPRDFILSKLRNSNNRSQRANQNQKPEVKVTLV